MMIQTDFTCGMALEQHLQV